MQLVEKFYIHEFDMIYNSETMWPFPQFKTRCCERSET
jgi:hypothetical protein